MSAAPSRAGPRQARPPMRTTEGSPERSAWAAAASVAWSGAFPPLAGGGPDGRITVPPSDHETSAGRIRVATDPGGPTAAATAAAASAPRPAVVSDVRTKVETLRATVSMSDWSWAS
jgi:hypothetical protein